MRTPRHPYVVIGGGLNGLVAAAWLGRQGRSVILLEQHESVGGLARTHEVAPGFHAPAVHHAIARLDAAVAKAIGIDLTTIDWIAPEPALTAVGPGGQVVRFSGATDETAASIAAVAESDAARWPDFVASIGRIAAVVADLNRRPPPDIDEPSLSDGLALLATGRRARKLGTRDLARLFRYVPMAVADVASEWFGAEIVRAAVASHAVFGHYAGPWSAGTGGMLLQRAAGDTQPLGSGMTTRGGPAGVTHALAKLAARHGVTIRTSARVARIRVEAGRVQSVVLADGEEIQAHGVIAAIDPRHTCLDLLEPADLPTTYRHRMANVRGRGVMAKINVALDGMPAAPIFGRQGIPGGRIVVAPDLDGMERAFDAVKYGEWSRQPWLELTVPSVLDPTLAPAGKHVASIAVHYAPRDLREGAWADQRKPLYAAVMETLAPYFPDFEARVVAGEVLTPADIEAEWGLPGGHVFHGELTLDQWWAGRPMLGWARYGTPVEGLYLSGAGTHPGGVAGGQSGLFAAQRV